MSPGRVTSISIRGLLSNVDRADRARRREKDRTRMELWKQVLPRRKRGAD